MMRSRTKSLSRRRESDDALASAALCLVGVGRNSLDVSEVCQRDRDILFIDQSLFIELSLVGYDLGAARIAPLLLDLEELVLDDAHQLVLVSEQALVVSDLLLQFVILVPGSSRVRVPAAWQVSCRVWPVPGSR